MSSPAAVNLPSTSGTRATRRSPGAVSLATPTFMAPPVHGLGEPRPTGSRGTPGSRDRITPARPPLRPDPGCDSDPAALARAATNRPADSRSSMTDTIAVPIPVARLNHAVLFVRDAPRA